MKYLYYEVLHFVNKYFMNLQNNFSGGEIEASAAAPKTIRWPWPASIPRARRTRSHYCTAGGWGSATSCCLQRVCELYPEDMASRNKTHVSATLSNLAANGIIIRVLEGKGGAPSIYELKPDNEEAANLLPLSHTEEAQTAVSA